MVRYRFKVSLLGFALGGALCAPALASDGVLEINQTCATTTGCFAGDAPLFPVTITPARAGAGSGSYRLTSNLEIAGAGTTAIEITANAVLLDLGGFAIEGPVTCIGVPVASCSPAGAGIGVLGSSDVTVKNGTITGMGGDAVQLTFSSRAEGLNVLHNGGDGIVLGDESIARGNIVASNGGTGLRCNSQCVVLENTSTGNGSDGIVVPSGTVNGNSASRNGGRGGLFGVNTSFAQNLFSGNMPPDQSGGHAGGGNVCADRSCSARGTRRFYLSRTDHNGLQAPTGCAVGFHFASLWELFDVTTLEYDTERGRAASDSGSSVPGGIFGWVRIGSSSGGSSGAGDANCADWSGTAGSGSAVALDDLWQDGNSLSPTDLPPWLPAVLPCSTTWSVWCVED
jgi:hypothetical protein